MDYPDDEQLKQLFGYFVPTLSTQVTPLRMCEHMCARVYLLVVFCVGVFPLRACVRACVRACACACNTTQLDN